jgi:hypothetical protein
MTRELAMKGNAILRGAMLGLVAACMGIPAATARAAEPTLDCMTGKPCEVVVTVIVCAPGGVSVDHEAIRLKRGNGNIPITWKLQSTLPGVEFAPRGIEFKRATGGQFKDVAAGEKQFKWVGVNSVPEREFPYTVNINRNGFECSSLDPSVVNE